VESPRWLASKGRYDEVPLVLARLEVNGATSETPSVKETANNIIRTAKHEAEIESSWKEVSPNGHAFPCAFCLDSLKLLQQCFQMGDLQNFRRLVICALAGFFQQVRTICGDSEDS
jgi:hypothetical protein